MAYRHYETEGLIVGCLNLGEANCLYQILTNDFGLINVLAQGVRRDRSKLRYHLENFSFACLTLIRGREFWRVVGASDLESVTKLPSQILPFFKKITLVLQRLIQGEELNSLIYQDLKQSNFLLLDSDKQLPKNMINLEIFILTRLLIQLGYLAPSSETKNFLLAKTFAWPEIELVENFQPLLIKQINQALAITQL